MQREKTKQEIFDSYYLSKQDIRHLFNISYRKACKIYDLASEIDDKELGKYRIEDTRVRKKIVFKIYGISEKEFKL